MICNKRQVCIALVAALLIVPGILEQAKSALELEGAIAKEQVDGDLKIAVFAYRKIASDASAPRYVRAKALLHLGGCYEKLGKQSKQIYEQILRDFGDQSSAAAARARLAKIR